MMVIAKTMKWDVARHLRDPEEMAAYLDASIEAANGDSAFIAKALGDIARAIGMSKVARQTGLSRESLYKALSGERKPSFETILKVVKSLGLQLHAQAVEMKNVDIPGVSGAAQDPGGDRLSPP